MTAEYLSPADAQFLREYAAIDEARGIINGPGTLRRIANQYSEKPKCGSRFPFSGYHPACDRPVNHEMAPHRYTRPGDGWQVFWDDAK